jgi:RimJ/RimL family protein N-acetyltransferase
MREVPTIHGQRLCLRPLRETDREERLAIGGDPEFIRLNGGNPNRGPAFGPAAVDRWLKSFPDSLRWAIEFDGRLIGEARLDAVDLEQRRASFAIGIFGPNERDRGLGTEGTRLVLTHAFEVLGLTRVDLRVLSFNARAIRCYEKCGFVRFRVDRNRAYVDGHWRDDVVMRATADAYFASRTRERGA